MNENIKLDELRKRSVKLLIDHLHMLGYSGAEAEQIWSEAPTIQMVQMLAKKPLKPVLETHPINVEPTGWKLVPLEPTDEMLLHFAGTPFHNLSPSKQRAAWYCYQAMIAAAPTPP